MPKILNSLLLLLLPATVLSETPRASSLVRSALDKAPKQTNPEVMLPFEDGAAWSLSAGALWRQIGEVDFHSRHQASIADLPAFRRPRDWNTAGSSSPGASHTYSDGYVYPDVNGTTQTWFWGYENNSQVSGNTLNFHGAMAEGFTRLSSQEFNSDWSDDLAGAGFFVDLESPEFLRRGKLGLSAKLGYSYTEDESSHSSLAFRARQQAGTREFGITDAYDITPIAPIPPAPFNGTAMGPGPVIDNVPIRSFGSPHTTILDDEVYTRRIT
ncbi:MAG: hypothetical protein ACAH88_09265, partial [Roseimicrobium sp.]